MIYHSISNIKFELTELIVWTMYYGNSTSTAVPPLSATIWFTFSFSILITGFLGLMFSSNFIIVIIFMELVFLGAGLTSIGTSWFLFDITGQIYALLFLVIAAVESVIGLSLFVSLYRQSGTIDIYTSTSLRY